MTNDDAVAAAKSNATDCEECFRLLYKISESFLLKAVGFARSLGNACPIQVKEQGVKVLTSTI